MIKMKCISKASSKSIIKFNLKYSLKKEETIIKLKSKKIKKEVFNYKFFVPIIDKMSLKSKNKYIVQKFDLKYFINRAYKKSLEYEIKNEKILKEIIEYREIANCFIKLYLMENSKIFFKKSDCAYVLLKENENKITSLEEFRKMPIKEVITDKVIFILNSL